MTNALKKLIEVNNIGDAKQSSFVQQRIIEEKKQEHEAEQKETLMVKKKGQRIATEV